MSSCMVMSALEQIQCGEMSHQGLQGLGRVALVTNQSVTAFGACTALEIVSAKLDPACGSRLVKVFGPQHGYWQTEQDNMRETPDLAIETPKGETLPLLSLYGLVREPTDEQMEGVDTFLLDLVDVGCRIYTYMLTLAGVLRRASGTGRRVVVLDRPNPLGIWDPQHPLRCGGPMWESRWLSFVGWYPIPFRHGLTMGELGQLFTQWDRLDVTCEVIPVKGLARQGQNLEQIRPQLSRHWTPPSPNLPTWDTAYFFPSFVALEATALSEGRGTTLPFRTIGAEGLPTGRILAHMKAMTESNPQGDVLRGLQVRRHDFRPTFNKHAGAVCSGLFFTVEDADKADPVQLGLQFLYSACAVWQEKLQWKAPGYEYNYEDPPLHLILGQAHWKDLFDEVRAAGDSRERQEKFNSYCHAAKVSAEQFVQEVKDRGVLLY